MTKCVVCFGKDGAHLVIAKRDLEKHRKSERHRSSVARLELKRTICHSHIGPSAGTDAASNGDDDQAFMHDTEDMHPLPCTSNDVSVFADEDTIMSIADAPVKLPEPSQDYYDEYRAAVLQGEKLFEVRLPPYKEPDDVGFDHDGDFIQYV